MNKYSLMLLIALVACGCSAKPVFFNGKYYMVGDSDCRQFAGVSEGQIICYASDGAETEYRYAIPDNQKQQNNQGLDERFYKQQRQRGSSEDSCKKNWETGQCY